MILPPSTGGPGALRPQLIPLEIQNENVKVISLCNCYFHSYERQRRRTQRKKSDSAGCMGYRRRRTRHDAPEAMNRVQKSYDLVLDTAKNGREIYGLTVGVGLNKDHKVLSANGELSDEVKAASRRFNYSTLRSHSIAAGPILDPKLVRLAMAIRLNTLLNGGSGVQPRVAEL